jgi:hypothetical protein
MTGLGENIQTNDGSVKRLQQLGVRDIFILGYYRTKL